MKGTNERILGALRAAMRQLVLAGLPTTTTRRVSLLATSLRAFPWTEKMAALSINKSFLCIPLLLGLAPMSMATSL